MGDREFLEFVQPVDRPHIGRVLKRVADTQIPQCLPSTLQVHSDLRVATLIIVSIGGVSEGYLVGVNVESEGVHAGEELAVDLVPPGCLLRDGEKEELQSEAGGLVPSTTLSGCIFGKVKAALSNACGGADQSLMGTLERLCHLGEEEHWLLDVDEFNIEQPSTMLGKGGFGMTLTANFRGSPVALKVPAPMQENPLAVLPAFFNELRVLRRVRHPHIVLFFGAAIEARTLSIVLAFERLFGHTLTDEVTPPPDGPSPAGRRQMLLEIAGALRFLHDQRPSIVHGDVKSDNVFVEHVGSGRRAKLLDLGLARLMGHHMEAFGGSVRWAAPEVLSPWPGVHPGTAADVFSFGRLIYFAVLGQTPHRDCTKNELHQLACRGHVPSLAWPESCAALQIEAMSLTHTCLMLDPAVRPAMDVVQGRLHHWPIC
eukprot:NODE_939_length_1304_cov_333.742194.p1 GENE.NODE_939_length_1304_cov_333.742194~~NODE_939_length_1304_cov_333.742194.p1  ORF type:complete len:428 (+),score=108.12 NODE_939_length_1304_cov_333.742194:3-1286(+)